MQIHFQPHGADGVDGADGLDGLDGVIGVDGVYWVIDKSRMKGVRDTDKWLYKKGANERANEGVNEGANEGANEGVNEGANEGANEGVNEGVNEGANEGTNERVGVKLSISEDYLLFYKYLLAYKSATVYSWTFRNVIRDGRLERRELIKVLALRELNKTDEHNNEDASVSV